MVRNISLAFSRVAFRLDNQWFRPAISTEEWGKNQYFPHFGVPPPSSTEMSSAVVAGGDPEQTQEQKHSPFKRSKQHATQKAKEEAEAEGEDADEGDEPKAKEDTESIGKNRFLLFRGCFLVF